MPRQSFHLWRGTFSSTPCRQHILECHTWGWSLLSSLPSPPLSAGVTDGAKMLKVYIKETVKTKDGDKKNKRQTKMLAHFLTPFPQFQTLKTEIFLTEELLSASASVTPNMTQSRWDTDSSCLQAAMQAAGTQAAGAQTARRQRRSEQRLLTGGCEPPLRCCVWGSDTRLSHLPFCTSPALGAKDHRLQQDGMQLSHEALNS